MTSFVEAATAYPTVVYTVLLGVVLFYWLLAVVGLVDIQSADMDFDTGLNADASTDDVGDLAAYLVTFGLSGVPFSVVITLLTLIGWTLTCLAAMWVLPLVPTSLLQIVVGTAVLAGSFVLAVPFTARAIRPMRGLFVTHRAMSNDELVGQTCTVLSGSVDEHFGRAEVSTRGASLNIRVWATTPNDFGKGAPAVIVEYDRDRERYRIAAEP